MPDVFTFTSYKHPRTPYRRWLAFDEAHRPALAVNAAFDFAAIQFLHKVAGNLSRAQVAHL